MKSYNRTIRKFLVDEYQVRPKMVHGGSHDAFVFAYNGPRRITLRHDDNGNAIALKMQDIRRELGKPPLPKIIQHRKREESADGAFVAAYRGARPDSIRLRFSVPTKLVEPFAEVGVSIEEGAGPDSWILRPDPTIKKPRFTQGVAIGYSDVEAPLLDNCPIKPFGKSPANIEVIDGMLVVHSDPAMRVPVKEMHRGKRTVPAPIEINNTTATEAVTISNDVVTSAPKPASLAEEEMLAALRTIRAVEREGRYELVRTVSGRWEFRPRARTIRLED